MKTFIKILIFIAFMVFSVSLTFCQENDFISRLKTQLLLYRTQKADQIIVIQTDKTLYRPGERMWMKGYIADAITHTLSLKSIELSVQLTDNMGINVFENKYPIKNGVIDCSFSIPADLPGDVYYLIAFTPEIESVGIQEVFKKEIIIARPENFNLIPRLDYSKPFFDSERKETATIVLKDYNGKQLSGKKFEYQIISGERELLSGKGKTGVNGGGEIVFITPSQQKGGAMMVSIEIPSGYDRLNLISKIPLASEKINISFFPEGGKLVPGIPQMIIYEAKDQLGNPVSIKGDIIDESGKIVTSTATIQPGLGVFSLLNGFDQKMMFKITSDIGNNQKTLLPQLTLGSMSIAVKKNDGKNLSLMLGRAPKSERAKFVIVAASNGEMIWASDFELEQAGLLNIPLDNFRSEISSVAVFSEGGELVAQRLVYTGKSQTLNITFSPDKSGLKIGEDGTIKVKITEPDGKPVKAELAVSFSDKYTFPTSAACVVNLNYGLDKPLPFKESLDKVNKIALDYYLVANSLKGFDWSQVLIIDPTKALIIRSNGMRVSGTVVDTKDFPIPNALISLTSSSLQQFNARSDQHGVFVINLPVPVEMKNLSATATDETGKGNYRVLLNKSFKDELSKSVNNISVNDWKILDQLFTADYFGKNQDFYKTGPSVKVRSSEKKTKDPYWKKYLSGSSNLLEIVKTIRPYELIGGKIVFRGANSFNAQDGALIVVDGQKIGTDASQLSMLNPQDIEDIQILLNPVDMARYTGLNSVGIIEIKTKKGGEDLNKTTEAQDILKENAAKLFVPKAIGNDKYDLKTTLLWIPVIYTDENGEATISFKTGNIKSSFVLEIAGFTENGLWIGKQAEFKVE